MSGSRASALLLNELVDMVADHFQGKCNDVELAKFDLDYVDVMFGLLARQYQLWASIMIGPSTWAVTTGPILMRSIMDAYIVSSWIAKNPDSARPFKLYSAGRLKLLTEHARQYGNQVPSEYTDYLEQLINSERWTALLPVESGNWNNKDIRTMSVETDLKEAYDMVYAPMSADVHAEWMTLRQYYLRPCEEESHQRHWLPRFERPPLRPDVMPGCTDIFALSARAILGALSLTIDDAFWTAVNEKLAAAIDAQADERGWRRAGIPSSDLIEASTGGVEQSDTAP
jgi:hypothetical protein